MSRLLIGTVLLVISLAPASWAQQPSSVPVGTLPAVLRPITQSTDFVGRIEAMQRVEIRARITGFLEEVGFTEGAVVKEGDELYAIEPDTFDAAVQQARGALLQAQAKFANASAQRARTQELARTDAASKALLDERVAAERNAQGEVVIADANLKTATVNLTYTRILAPISGQIGRTKVTKGNVVSPELGPLTTIVSRDPMYATFPVSQREFLKVGEQEARRRVEQQVTVHVRFADGTQYPEVGRINFVDVTVDRATDTVLVRATIPNPNGALIDGQLVRIAVQSAKPEEKVLVPQTALIVDQQGPYVFLVVDGKATVRRIKLGGESGPYAIIDDGLKGGEQVIVQGMETLRPGTAVLASPAQAPADQG